MKMIFFFIFFSFKWKVEKYFCLKKKIGYQL